MEKRLQRSDETAKQFGVEDQLLLIEKERLDLSDQMEKYLDSFDGYLYAGNESSYCPIRAGMELSGKRHFCNGRWNHKKG